MEMALQERLSITIEHISSITVPMVHGTLYKLALITENQLAPMTERKRG